MCGAVFTWVGANGRRTYCDGCKPKAVEQLAQRKNAARNAKWTADPNYRARQRAVQLKKNYGLSVERYDEMLAQQGCVCALCGRPPKVDGVRSAGRLHVDHDHSTGVTRRLLCLNCNRAIGYFRDDPEVMIEAARYVRHFRGYDGEPAQE